MVNGAGPRSVRRHKEKLRRELFAIVDRILARPENNRGPWHLPNEELEKLKDATNDRT